jgi:hypothetical protein
MWCYICKCDVPLHGENRHNNGRKHMNKMFTKEEKEKERQKRNLIFSKNRKLDEFKMIFPKQASVLNMLNYPNIDIFNEVLSFIYNIMLETEFDVELSDNTYYVLIEYLTYVYDLDDRYIRACKRMGIKKYINIFIYAILYDKDELIVKTEIERDYDNSILNDLLDGGQIEMAQSQIIYNYNKSIKEYVDLYDEARLSFNENIKKI